eukprot:COSAG02_NODE_280_length_25797_cov_66.644447_15_plen_146_part_00
MAAPALVWYGECPVALRATLAGAGLRLLPAERDAWTDANACVIACPPADSEVLHESFRVLPPLQELSFRIPAGSLIIWDPYAQCPATVPTDVGMTGVPRPAGLPSARDPWHLNDYALARWAHIVGFLVRTAVSFQRPLHVSCRAI